MMRNGWAGLVRTLALATLLAGCATQAAAPTTGPTVEPSVPPTGAAGLFTGHDTCAEEADTMVCERTVTDPRLTGTLRQGPSTGGDDPNLFSQWSTWTMTDGDKGWTCKEFMQGATEIGTGFRDQVCTGDGGYAGLTAYILSVSGNAADDFGVLGWVEETP